MLRELFLVFYKSKVTISLNYASVKSGTIACFKCLILLHLRILLHPRISGFLIAVPKAPRKKVFSGIHIFYEIRDNNEETLAQKELIFFLFSLVSYKGTALHCSGHHSQSMLPKSNLAQRIL